MTPFGHSVLEFLAGEARRTNVETRAARAALHEHYLTHKLGNGLCRQCRALDNAAEQSASEHASAAFRLDAFIYRGCWR